MNSNKKGFRNLFIAGLFASAFMSTAAVAAPDSNSDNTTACGAVMCLISSAAGNTPTECETYLTAYFEIVTFHNGSFSPSRTLKSRANFLNQCQSSDSSSRTTVNNKYGSQQFGF